MACGSGFVMSSSTGLREGQGNAHWQHVCRRTEPRGEQRQAGGQVRKIRSFVPAGRDAGSLACFDTCPGHAPGT